MVLIVSSFLRSILNMFSLSSSLPFNTPSPCITPPPFPLPYVPPFPFPFPFPFPIPFTLSTPLFPPPGKRTVVAVDEQCFPKLKCPDGRKMPSKMPSAKNKLSFSVCYPNYHLPSVKKTFRMVKRTISAFQLSCKRLYSSCFVLLTFRILF